MKELFEQYGGVIITVFVISSFIGVIGYVIGTDASGPVGKAFTDIITKFFTNVGL